MASLAFQHIQGAIANGFHAPGFMIMNGHLALAGLPTTQQYILYHILSICFVCHQRVGKSKQLVLQGENVLSKLLRGHGDDCLSSQKAGRNLLEDNFALDAGLVTLNFNDVGSRGHALGGKRRGVSVQTMSLQCTTVHIKDAHICGTKF